MHLNKYKHFGFILILIGFWKEIQTNQGSILALGKFACSITSLKTELQINFESNWVNTHYFQLELGIVNFIWVSRPS